MANLRTYNAQAVKASGIALGGMTRITTSQGYGEVSRTTFDGRQGTSAIHRVGKFVRGTLSSVDVTRALSILTASPTVAADYLEFYEAEDATSPTTYTNLKILKPRWTSLAIRAAGRDAPAAFDLGFECLWIKEDGTTPADDFHDVVSLTKAVAEATVQGLLTNPIIVQGVTSAAHGAKSIDHGSSFSVRIDGDVLRDTNAGFNGPDSVIFTPRVCAFDLSTKDSAAAGTPTKSTMQDLLDATIADLVVTLGQVNGAGDATITLKNAKFIEDPEEFSSDGYSSYSPNGECQWLDVNGTTHRTLSGANPIMTIA